MSGDSIEVVMKEALLQTPDGQWLRRVFEEIKRHAEVLNCVHCQELIRENRELSGR